MTTKEKKEVSFLTLFLLSIILVQSFLLYSWTIDKNQTQEIKEKTIKGTVAGTGSMRPFVDKNIYPNITVSRRELSPYEHLKVNAAYVYNRTEGNESDLIFHRLIAVCPVSNETKYVFLGDNNPYADALVTRDQIIQEVIGVEFK